APSALKSNQYLSAFKRSIAPQVFTISDRVAQNLLGNAYDAAKSNQALVQTVQARVQLDVQKETIRGQSSDVIGVLPGTDLKDEYLFVTAHYDHLGKRGDSVIYYGADDDGSGTVSVIEIARAFARAK